MKIYEYAKKRNIKSRDVVKKIHDLGYKHIKNHLSLVPLKIIDKLDEFDFAPKKKKLQPKTNIFISLECAPFSKSGISEIVRNKIKKNKRNKNHIIIPRNQIDMKLDIFLERNVIIDKKKIKGTVYKTQYKNDIYYLIEDKFINDKEIYQLAFFSLMAIETVKFLNNKIDKINIHDWELGLFPLMFKKIKSQFYNTIVEFSIYGATYKGIYAKNILTTIFGIDKKYLGLAEYAGSINFLKAGLVTADKIDIDKATLTELKTSYLKDYVYDNM